MIYVDAYLIPIRIEMLGEDYAGFARMVAVVYRECGALRVVELRLDADVYGGEAYHAEGARDALAEAGPLRTSPKRRPQSPAKQSCCRGRSGPTRRRGTPA